MSDIQNFFETRITFENNDFDLMDGEITARVYEEIGVDTPASDNEELFNEIYENIENGIRKVFEVRNVTELKTFQMNLAYAYIRDIYELPQYLKKKIESMNQHTKSTDSDNNRAKELVDEVNKSIEILKQEKMDLAVDLDMYFNYQIGQRDSLLEAAFYFFNKGDYERADKLKEAYHLERLSFTGMHSGIGNMWSFASAYTMHMNAMAREAEENKSERLEEFDFLYGFKLLKVEHEEASGSDDIAADVTIMTFYNENHVAVDVLFIDGEIRITEPYAINNDFEPYKG